MLGDLLEFSIAADPLGPAVDFYRTLGFREAPVGNIVPDAYVPLALDRVTVGLRVTGPPDPVPAFVRPDLKSYLRGLKHSDVALEFAETADDQFHRAGFRDPNGLLVVLLEARTCAALPPDPATVSPLGEFLEYSMPTHSIDETVSFWEKLGVRRIHGGEAPQPWCRIEGHGLTLGVYAGRRFRPGLCFSCDNAEARFAYLEAKGFRLSRHEPFGLPGRAVATLEAPAHPIYLAASGR
jgi:catechol 2,3-dioxygenase-like lactoylglutathione lyase family enzyme